MKLTKRVARATLRRLLPQPVEVRHAEYSMIFSADDEEGRPSPLLLDLAHQAIGLARGVSMTALSGRMGGPPYYPEVWPGESYKILAAVVSVLKPAMIIEIGTGGGTSTLAMKQSLPAEGRIISFDPIGWREFPGTLLRSDDFADGRLEQLTDDLTQPAIFERHRASLERAELFFIDAAKDGVMEQQLLDALETVRFRRPPILVMDDIRVWNMLRIWRQISRPKLDLTSFGHWTGTGLVEWGPGR